jgi:hypothetical protein
MALIQSGVSGSTLMTVDPTYTAARAALRPVEQLNTYGASAQSGQIATPAAGGYVFNMRFAAGSAGQAQYALIQKVQVSAAILGVAVTTSQEVALGLMMLRNYTANETAALAIAVTGSNGKYRTSLPTSQIATNGQLQIANTTAITGGTRTADSAPISIVSSTSGTAIGTTSIPLSTLYEWNGVSTPIVLANNEGFAIQNMIAWATGSVRFTVNVTWTEVATTSTTSF